VDSQWFPFAQLGCAAVAGLLWFTDTSRGWVIAIALAPLMVRLLAGRMPVRTTPLDAPLLLFLLTACVGVWASYDREGWRAIFHSPVGWQKFWGLCLATLVFYGLAAMETETQLHWTLGLLATFGAGVAAWFTATNDWTANPADLDFFIRLGTAIQAWLPPLPGHRLNANVAGGAIASLLPLSPGLATEAKSASGERRWSWTVWGLGTGAVMALGLLLTVSRGAWVGVIGGLALGAAWWLAGRWVRGRRRVEAFVALIVVGALVGAVSVLLIPPLRAATLGSQAAANRGGIFSEAALLVRDYPFTGSGLGSFPLVHSTYALMIHVPILTHAHAMLLDVAIEQGVLGAVAMAVVLGGAAWLGLRALANAEQARPHLAVGLLSLAILIVHSLADDLLYSSRGMLLLWVPAGLVIAAWRGRGDGETGRRGERGWGRKWRLTVAAVGALVVLVLIGRPLAVLWYANLGAVAQTRAELPHYDYNHFDNPSLDQIRQREDLSAAEGYFDRALALDPGQVTARTRLAQIALGRGEYQAALEHAQAAWEAGHRDRVARLVLGDALVAQGSLEEAAVAVRGLDWAEMRLDGQAWYRYWVNQDWQRAAYAWRAVLLLDPEDAYARGWVGQAEERAAGSP
jgi:O-antigen ligase